MFLNNKYRKMLENSKSEIELADKSQCDTSGDYYCDADNNKEVIKFEKTKQDNEKLIGIIESLDSVIRIFSEAVQNKDKKSINILSDFLNKVNVM